MQLIMSIIGMAVLIAIAILFSSNRRAIRLRTVGGAFLIQLAIGAFVLYVPAGRSVLKGCLTRFLKLLDMVKMG